MLVHSVNEAIALIEKAEMEGAGIDLMPVDSEHSAIFQCMQGRGENNVNRIILTASGGPFFGKTKQELENVTVKDALNHPNWSMGAKITIDSATLANKGLEVIEAMRLYRMPLEKVDVERVHYFRYYLLPHNHLVDKTAIYLQHHVNRVNAL